MATRRRLPWSSYSAGDVPAPRSGHRSTVPPPPNGKIPNRLPIGIEPSAAPVDQGTGQLGDGGGGDSNADPMQLMLRLLQQVNQTWRHDAR